MTKVEVNSTLMRAAATLLGALLLVLVTNYWLKPPDAERLAEASFLKLVPTGVRTLTAHGGPRSPETITAQAEFKRHGLSAVQVLARHTEYFFSKRRVAAVAVKGAVYSGDEIKLESWIEAERLVFGMESIGQCSGLLLGRIRAELLRNPIRPGRNAFAATLCAYAGDEGAKMLCDELTNPSEQVREHCRRALAHYIGLVIAKRVTPTSKDVGLRVWEFLVNGDDAEWQRWALKSPKLFGVDDVRAHTQLLDFSRNAEFKKRAWAIECLVDELKAKQLEISIVRSNFAFVFAEHLTDPEPAIRGHAIEQLVRADERGTAFVVGLQRALTDSNSMIKADASNALHKIALVRPL